MENCAYLFDNYLNIQEFLVLQSFFVAFVGLILIRSISFKFDLLFVFIILFGAFLNIYLRYKIGCVPDPYNFFGLFHYNIPDLLVTFGSLTLIYRLVIKN